MSTMENTSINLDDSKIGSSVEEINILYPNKRKNHKSNKIQKYLAAFIILFCLIFSLLIVSDIIPLEDKFNIFNKQDKKNISNKSLIQANPNTTNPQQNQSTPSKSSEPSNKVVRQSNKPAESSNKTPEQSNKKPEQSNKPTQSSNVNLPRKSSKPYKSTNYSQTSILTEKKPKKSLNGNIGLNPNYEKIDPNHTNYTYIPIVGIDDVHGLFFPKINKVKTGNTTLVYKTGGLEYITKYVNILRKEFGAHRVLFFDGGDFYQGGIDSVLFDGEIMQEFYNLLGINGSTIGNHEFDYSRKWVESKIKKGNYKMLINNVMDNSTKKKEGIFGNNHKTSELYDIKLQNGDIIKIGVIGLSFNMKNDKKMPNTWGNRDTWDNVTFLSYMEGLEEESNKLREKGASAIIALTHFGLVCNQTLAMKLDMYNKTTYQPRCFREDDDSVLYKLLDKLKPGIIDGIIGGDTHMEMHHWENNIPMMSTPTHARYINIMYLPFKKNENGKYILVNDEMKIEGPIPACEKIFKNFQHCELISSKESEIAGELIEYYWHGVKIEKDTLVQPIYEKYYQKYKDFAEQDIVNFEGFDKIKVDKSGDCLLCNTYLDAIVGIKGADFAIINRGIFPEELVPGTITRAEFYNQMPYLDKICTVNITGEELKKIVTTVQSVGKAFYPSSNLKQTIQIDNSGSKKVTNVEIYINGTATEIDDKKIYKMASSLFVLSETSGEDFAKGDSYKVIHEKAINNKINCSNITIDNEMSEYFKGKGTIDISNKVDPKKPRIIIKQKE